MISLAVTGPESSGKTTLARWLHEALPESVLVEEYARQWLEDRGSDPFYSREDVLHIGAEQFARIRAAQAAGPPFVVADTEMFVMDIWMKEVFGGQEAFSSAVAEQHFDLYLLCAPDLPWEYDPLRENPVDRDRLFARYQDALASRGVHYRIVTGTGEQRHAAALRYVQELLQARASSRP